MMDAEKKAIEITFVADRETAATILEELEAIGLTYSYSIPGRRDLLQERKGLLRMLGKDSAVLHDPITIITFLISPELEQAIIGFIVEKGGLTVPGRGSVFSKEVALLKSHEQCRENKALTIDTAIEKRGFYSDLTGICCIAQRGDGDLLARVGLDTGSGVPSITLGIGTGLRDKIGLWRIAIPAEKEIVNLVTTSHNAETVMQMMINIGALDNPGKGFVYLYPIKTGLVDVKAYVGLSRQAASIEQIVSVIDEIKGGTKWRRREFSKHQRGGKKRNYLSHLVNFTLICNEGRSADLIKAAMVVGAGGATTSQIKYRNTEKTEANPIPPAREISEMIIGENQIEAVVKALEDVGALDDHTHGQIYCSAVPKAFTYQRKGLV
jgi:nitrogen regulatory protein PII